VAISPDAATHFHKRGQLINCHCTAFSVKKVGKDWDKGVVQDLRNAHPQAATFPMKHVYDCCLFVFADAFIVVLSSSSSSSSLRCCMQDRDFDLFYSNSMSLTRDSGSDCEL